MCDMTSASEVMAWLRKTGDEKTKAGMARYSIPSDNAFGVGVGVMKKQAKVPRCGRAGSTKRA